MNKNYRIQCYKHNGRVYQSSGNTLILDEANDYLVCSNYKVDILEPNNKSYKTKELAIIFFFKNCWFNCIAQFKKNGLYYYCNISSPYIIDEDVIKYIDYDLDLRVYPNGSFKVLDFNEYKYHKRKMKYSNEIDRIVKKELDSLIKMCQNKEGPFDKNIIESYKNKFWQIINSEE